MAKLKISLVFIIASLALFIYYGCASTSTAIRYREKAEKTKRDNSTIRFALKDTTEANNITDEEIKDTADDTSDPDEIPADSKKIDISSLLKKYTSNNAESKLNADQLNSREKILMEIIKYLDTPYKYGGDTKNGIDCSAFTKEVYGKALAIDLERSAREQYHEGEIVPNRNELQFGDLVFFNTRRFVKPGHVGIYIGEDLFAHASSRNGVTVSSLDDTYYAKRYMGARRFEGLPGSGSIMGRN